MAEMKKLVYGIGEKLYSQVLQLEELTDLTRTKELPRARGVYILFGEDDTVLYVGETKQVRQRVRHHLKGQGPSKRFYKDIRKIKYAHASYDKHLRGLVESLLDVEYKPLYNFKDEDMATSHGLDEKLLHDIIFYARELRLR